MSTWKFTTNCLFDCTSVIKSSGSHKRVLSTGVEQLCAPLSAKLIYLCRPALQRPNWATRYDCHDAPCAKTWAKRRVFSFMEAMSSYGSWLWLICKASSIMRRFFFFLVLCFVSHLRSFVCRRRPRHHNQWKMTKSKQSVPMFHRKQIENRQNNIRMNGCRVLEGNFNLAGYFWLS